MQISAANNRVRHFSSFIQCWNSSHTGGSKMDNSYDSDFELPQKRKPFGELSTNVPSRRQQGEAEFEDKKSKRVTKKKEIKTQETVASRTQDDRKRLVNVSTQCGPSSRSYGKTSEHLTFRSLLLEVIYTKDATLDFCFRHKLLPSERLCPTCGKKMTLITDSKVSDGKRWYCRVRKGPHSHEHRLTMRTDTFFSKSNMTLEEILQFIYLWVHGNSQDTIAHELGTSSNTDVDWASFCREVCEETLMRRSEKIGGKDVVVEIDESKFAKRKYNVGHRVTGGWVFGGREKDDKTKIFMEPVEDRTADTLLAIIQKWILLGSIIWSDCWKAYGKIPNLPEGYKHGTVNHSTNFVNPETVVCTNRIESDWRHAKQEFPAYGTVNQHYSGYLSTFIWKRRNFGKDLFMELIQDIAAIYQRPCQGPSQS